MSKESWGSSSGSWIARSIIALAIVRLNDFDPPEPPQTPDKPSASQAFLGTVYSRTFFNNVGRIKEAYFPDEAACQKFVSSNLEESEGVIDVNAWDTGKCYPATTQKDNDPQVATIYNRSFIGNFQFNQNLKIRYFGSAQNCAHYIRDYLKETAGLLDINMWDSASCHSTATGKRTAYAENSLSNGVRISTEIAEEKPLTADEISYIGTTYLRNIFGNLSRENVTYFPSQIACERYVQDFLREAEHPFDLNALDSAVCLPRSGNGSSTKFAASSSGKITLMAIPASRYQP